MTKHRAYISLGSNTGDRRDYLEKSLVMILKSIGNLKSKSPIYETQAWGHIHQDDFLNQVICIHTEFSPTELLRRLLQIENNLGRQRTFRYGPRTIDLDILLYDDLIVNSHELVIPHPEMHRRKFILVPIVSIAPDLIHPVFKKTMFQLTQEVEDNLQVREYNNYEIES